MRGVGPQPRLRLAALPQPRLRARHLAGRAASSTRELVEELPLPFEFRESGGLIFFLTPEQGDVVEEFVAARRRDGLPMEMIDGAEVRRLVPPIRAGRARRELLPGRRAHQHAAVRARRWPRAPAATAPTIREGVTVTALARDGDRVVGVETDAGRIEGSTWSCSRPAPGRGGCCAPTGSTRRSAPSASA